MKPLLWRGLKLTVEGLLLGVVFVWALAHLVGFAWALVVWLWALSIVFIVLAVRFRRGP